MIVGTESTTRESGGRITESGEDILDMSISMDGHTKSGNRPGCITRHSGKGRSGVLELTRLF